MRGSYGPEARPVITVTRPNTAVTWRVGQAKQIKWSHNLGTAEAVDVDVSRDGGATWQTIAANVPNSGTTNGGLNWTVTGPATSLARVRVRWVRDPAVADTSDVSFTIQ